jgi:hypothetical protein
MTQPAWLAEIIAEAQLRNVSREWCSCGAQVLKGLNDDWCAFVVRADIWPLSPYGEMLALLSGRATYDLHRHGDHYRLYARDRWNIRGRPAGTLYPAWRSDVVADHVCGYPLPSTRSVYDAAQVSRPDPNQPPPF